MIDMGGKFREVLFHAQVPEYRKPKIVKEVTRDGVRHYQDDSGGLHVADIVDRVFGKPNPGMMDLKRKGIVQRKFRR